MTNFLARSARRLAVGLFSALLAGVVVPALAAGGGNLMHANTSLSNTGSLQNGAKLYFNYCSGCHGLQFMRYSRIAEDLGLSEDQVTKNFIFTDAKFGDPVKSALSSKDGETWFGKAPPDLSLVVRARGADWVYSYLKSFYLDPARPLGWNNTVFPNASMPNPLWQLQGVQTATFKEGHNPGEHVLEAFEIQQAGTQTPAQFDETARDLTAFLQYAAEPAALKRTKVGIWVLLYLSLFTLLAWLLKNEYWKDVH